MKAHYYTMNGRLSFEITGENQKSIFKELAAIQELFEAETSCGVCESPNIRMAVRSVEKYEYYELHCLNPECRARFAFGQTRDGGALFPKRKNEDGHWMLHRGWSRYEPPKDEPVALPPEAAGILTSTVAGPSAPRRRSSS